MNGTSRKVRRAQTLLKADADGPDWTDAEIGETFSCRTRTVERLRQRLCEQGFEATLNRAERPQPAVAKCWTAARKRASLRCGWGHHPRAMPTGPCDCRPARWSSWNW